MNGVHKLVEKKYTSRAVDGDVCGNFNDALHPYMAAADVNNDAEVRSHRVHEHRIK